MGLTTATHPLGLEDGAPDALTGPGETGYGRFMENIPDGVKQSLRSLIAEMKDETLSARREEVKKAKQAREYWKGVQNIWWAESDQEWRFPFETLFNRDFISDQMPRYSFVTNIYQAFGLSIIAVLSQSNPHTRLFPQSTDQPEDVTTAKVGSEVIRLIQRNNEASALLERMAYFAWTDGKVAGYMRYVQDGLRFGFQDQPEFAEGQMQMPGEEANYSCPECGGQTPYTEMTTDLLCPGCGSPLDEGDIMSPEPYTVPQEVGSERIEKGQEVLDIFGALEVRTPMWCNKQHEFPYLIWSTEIHRSKLQFTYPHIREKISQETPSGGEDTYERQVRLRLHYSGIYDEAGTPSANLITFDRVWLRPFVFEGIADDTIRQQCYDLFPDGVYSAWAADQFAEARSENMDDHWTVMNVMPGDGQNRPAIGTALISIQERYNTLNNLVVENIEFGVPPIYADDSVLDFDAIEDTTAEPGSHYPVTPPPTGRVRDAFFQPQPTPLAAETYRYINDLAGPMGQFQVGAFPSLMGGSAANIDTASGYAMSRDQALGRQGIFWRAMKMFWDNCMVKGVKVYRDNRAEDIEIPLQGLGQEFESRLIRLDDLQGAVVVYSETEEQFPETWVQKRRTLMELLSSGSEEIGAVLHHPENMKLLKDMLGLDDLEIPGDTSRDKQWREIVQLLEEMPMEGEQGMESSVEVGPFDSHEVELAICATWINSAEGQKAKLQKPMGFMNVMAHAGQHQQAIGQAQQEAERKQLIMTAAMAQAEESGKLLTAEKTAKIRAEKPPAKAPAKEKK
jgi:hypothetical protein